MKKLRLTPHSIMCMMGFSYIASSSVIAPILSIHVKDNMSQPIEVVGLVIAIYFIVSTLTKIPLGVFAGGKKTISFLLFAFVVYSICPTLYPLTTHSILMLIFLRALQGLAYAFIGTASLILAALTISSVDRDRGMGTYTASLSLGLLAGPAITTFSIPLFGVSNTFYFAGLMGFIGIFAAFFLNRKISSIEKNWQIIDVAMNREALKSKISAIMRNKGFGNAFIGVFAFFTLFGVILAYAPLYAKQLSFGDEYVSMLFLVYFIATTVTRLSIGRIIGRISKSTLMILSIVFAASFSFALTIFTDNLVFAGIFASIGAIHGVLFPVGSMLIAEHIQPSRNILANSLYMMGIDIGQGIAPLITAGVAVQLGLKYSFIVSAVILVAAALMLVWLNMHKQP